MLPDQELGIFATTQGKWPVHTGIGRTQSALDGRRICTICVPFQSVCVPFQSVLGRHRGYVPIVKVVPIQTVTVHKQTETVRKQCKYDVRLEHAGSVLCPYVRAIFPVQSATLTGLYAVIFMLTMSL